MIPRFGEILKAGYITKILAHTSSTKKPETLSEHSDKTLNYCRFLIEKLALKEIFERILAQLVPQKMIPLFLGLVEGIVCHHDLGKINPVFQREKMKNNINMPTTYLDSKHSFYGKILFDNSFYGWFYRGLETMNLSQSDKKTACCLFFLLSQAIDRHHSPLKEIDELAMRVSESSVKSEIKDLNKIALLILDGWSAVTAENLSSVYTFNDGEYYNLNNMLVPEKKEALFYLYKLVYSLLIMSDYYATLDYMQGIPYFDRIQLITPELKTRCINNFYNFEFNKKLKNTHYCKRLLGKLVNDIEELDDLRTRILLESDEELKKAIASNQMQRVFYLNVPTGGGKTNISLKLALTLLESKNDIKRIFYVFPFINIIEQNHDVIKKTLGFTEEISAIYSSSPWKASSGEKNECLMYVLDNEFLNFPFVVMSNVNFFNTFVKADKRSNYRLINLVNSVVIIDEIQTLNDKDWTLFNDLIEFGSKYLNIYFIIMSATLPRLNLLSDSKTENVAKDLIKGADKYFNHKKFQRRVDIEYRGDIKDLSGILKLLKKELEVNTIKKILLVVNTVKDSLQLYCLLSNNEQKLRFDTKFSVYLLNSTILQHRRREIIKRMKEDDCVILVSTQSVESGVDIDCDFGIRDFAIFDSVEQIAGRINRNFNKDHSKLIVVNLLDEERRKASIYAGSYRWETIEKRYNNDSLINKFLQQRNFAYFYSTVLENIKRRDNDPIRESSMDVVKKGIRGLNFYELNKTDIIKQNTISLIVNVDIPCDEFSEKELRFIGYLCVNEKDKIPGEVIWRKYKEFNENFKRGHIEKKIDSRVWSGILSKFTISVERYKLNGILPLSGDMHFLRNGYSIEKGMDSTNLNSSSFTSFEDFSI